MATSTETTIIQSYLKTDLPDIRSGDTIRVHQKVKEGNPSTGTGQARERIQVFEGVVLAIKHGKGINATITVRKISQGVAVERIFPIHAPFIQKIEIAKRAKVRRAKLYYLREAKGKKARLKAKEFGIEVAEPETSSQAEAKEEVAEKESAAEQPKETSAEKTKES